MASMQVVGLKTSGPELERMLNMSGGYRKPNEAAEKLDLLDLISEKVMENIGNGQKMKLSLDCLTRFLRREGMTPEGDAKAAVSHLLELKSCERRRLGKHVTAKQEEQAKSFALVLFAKDPQQVKEVFAPDEPTPKSGGTKRKLNQLGEGQVDNSSESLEKDKTVDMPEKDKMFSDDAGAVAVAGHAPFPSTLTSYDPPAAPVPGSSVRSQDLPDALSEQEGLAQGTVVGWDSGQSKWMVRVPGGEQTAVEPERLEVVPRSGSTVLVRGLKTALEMNQMQGTVQAWNADSRRWEVKLHDGEVKALNPENLQVLAEAPHATPCQTGPSASDKESAPTGPPPAKRLRTSDTSLDRLREIFAECDSNKDGVLTKIEFIKACNRDNTISEFFALPPKIRAEDGSRDQFEELFQKVDKDSDREIRWAELLGYYNERFNNELLA